MIFQCVIVTTLLGLGLGWACQFHVDCLLFVCAGYPAQMQFWGGMCSKEFCLKPTHTLHTMVHFAKKKIGVVYFESCVIFDTL